MLVSRIRKWCASLQSGDAQVLDARRYETGLLAVAEIRRQLRSVPDSRLASARTSSQSALAAAAEAGRRSLGLEAFDEQVLGALALIDGRIVEMQTGEGKTLAAALAVSALALSGPVHVLTANDYLAGRDAAWMRPVYQLLGMSVSSINQRSSIEERQAAYAADVLYATPNEVGFDFLREQLALDSDELGQRPLHHALIDEADSILIDEARIPLVIAGGRQDAGKHVAEMDRIVRTLARDRHYTVEGDGRNVRLREAGISAVEQALGCGNLYDPENLLRLIAIEEALHAHVLLRRDVDYIERDGEIQSIDELRGRVAENRRWPTDLQWALEMKEGLPLQPQGRVLGSITVGGLMALYERMCGMTGTAATEAEAFWREYQLRVVSVPTNRSCIRIDEPDTVFETAAERDAAVVDEVCRMHGSRRPVLIGAASVKDSERLSKHLGERDIPHRVLNARNDASEAAIIAEAGLPGAVTVSTNMAGRGIDIRLGGSDERFAELVRGLGGLAVIGLSRHEARRIDHQLRGRSGRQGDPGSSRFYVSLEDDIFPRYGLTAVPDDIDHLQRVIEGQHLDVRMNLRRYSQLTEEHLSRYNAMRRACLLDDSVGAAGRRAMLVAMDESRADYLEFASHLKAGLVWRSWNGSDPYPHFAARLNAAFQTLVESVSNMESESLAGETSQYERGATWTYMLNDTPMGTPSSRLTETLKRCMKSRSGVR